MTWNGIKDPNKISVGQVILLTDPNPTHTVVAGDTLSKLAPTYELTVGDTVSALAQKFGLRWVDIAAVNKLEDMDLIIVGQKLVIPARGLAR